MNSSTPLRFGSPQAAPGASPGALHRSSPPSERFDCRGFTLIELLVATAIIATLLALVGAAVSAARSNQKVENTRRLISKLNAVIAEQLSRYDSMTVDVSAAPSVETRGAYRAWSIRRNYISGDLPDRWTDVEYMAGGTWQAKTAPQRTYAAIWTDAAAKPSPAYAGAECLFMTVMMGGIADCLECGDLKTAEVGDIDGDGFNEFWDDWGNPIGFILWPCGVELPAGSGTKFFSGSRQLADPFSGYPRPTLGMKPLIYSAGPDGEMGMDGAGGFDRRSEACTLSAGSGGGASFGTGTDCGNPQSAAFMASGGVSLVDGVDVRGDNITNLDDEAKQ